MPIVMLASIQASTLPRSPATPPRKRIDRALSISLVGLQELQDTEGVDRAHQNEGRTMNDASKHTATETQVAAWARQYRRNGTVPPAALFACGSSRAAAESLIADIKEAARLATADAR